MPTVTEAEFIEFVALYQQLQAATKGTCSRLPILYRNDARFRELCHRADWLVFCLDSRVRYVGDTVMENVDKRYIAAREHYDAELEPYIRPLTAHDNLKELGLIDDSGNWSGGLELADIEEDTKSRQEVREEVEAIQIRLELGEYENLSDAIDEEVAHKVWRGQSALKRLIKGLVWISLERSLVRSN